MNPYANVARTLQESLSLSLSPIAVCITSSVPEGVPTFQGQAPAGCLFWQEAARGPFATSTPDHELCAIGVHTLHMAAPASSNKSELGQLLKVMADMEYVREEDVPNIPVLEQETKHVVYAPLAETPLPPDVVILFVHSQQGLIITEAVQQVEPDVPPTLGRPACAVIPQVVNTARAALSLGCCGARAYLNALTDDIALWAFPGSKVERYAERIAALAKANSVLGEFHTLRRKEVEAGLKPTVAESLSRLES